MRCFLFLKVTSIAKAVLYLLAKNPDKQEKLRKEIYVAFPNKNEPVTINNLKQLPYLRTCIKEAHRLLPAVAASQRATGRDLILKGYKIPKGTHILMPTYLMQEDTYFSNSKSFIPERWLRNESQSSVHPFAYLPYGNGVRSCIGRRFADLELSIFTIRLIREFEVSWHHDDLKLKSELYDTLDGKMKFRMTEVTY